MKRHDQLEVPPVSRRKFMGGLAIGTAAMGLGTKFHTGTAIMRSKGEPTTSASATLASPITQGNNGLEKITIHNAHCEGEIYLLGAHVTSWRPSGTEDVLWISRDSVWQDGKPIRGGVPICFPWFGPKADDPAAPPHGFARINKWQLTSFEPGADSTTVTLSLKSDASMKQWFAGDFEMHFSVAFGRTLTMSLTVENTGSAPFSVEEALHTYYNVGDIHRLELSGLDRVSYLDKTDGAKEKPQHGNIRFSAETNSVYRNTTSTVYIEDPVLHRRLVVGKKDSRDTVVWNPWAERAKSMPDFTDDQWPTMVCVEACNLGDNAVSLKPRERHTMTAIIEVERL